MTTELTMPQMGYDMQEGVIVRWLKAEGDTVRAGEPIAEIETDKAVVEFEAYTDGILQKILVSEGYSVPVGQPIAIIGLHATAPEGHAIDAMNSPSTPLVVAAPEPERTAEPETEPEPEPEPSEPPATASLFVRASPMARRLANQRGIDLSQVEGTGPGGRVTRVDVLNLNTGPEPVAEVEPEPVPEPEPEPVAEVETERGRAPEPEPEPEPVAEVEPEPVAEVEPEPVAEVEPEPVAEVEPEPVAEVEPEPEVRENLIPLSRMRQQIARVTVRSKQESRDGTRTGA
jgi:pyruvate dehydrogenase E2 component (dihydrolipoamide acetyltransferase)